MISDIKLAEMLCTRLIHDLTGPIGAVNNGAEFLSEETSNMQSEALDLITSSAGEAVHRLQFYRQAYGRLNEHGEANLGEKKRSAEEFFSSTKVKLDWPDSHTDAAEISIGQRMSRLLLNMLIIGAGALIKGGTLSVRLNALPEGGKEVMVRATGEVIKLDEDIHRILAGEAIVNQLTPKTALPFMMNKLAAEIDATFKITSTPDELVMRVIHLQQPEV